MIKKSVYVGLCLMGSLMPMLVLGDQTQNAAKSRLGPQLSSFSGQAGNSASPSQPSTQRLVVATKKAKQVSSANKPQSASTLDSLAGLVGKSKIKFNGFLSAGFGRTNAGGSIGYKVPGHGELSNKFDFSSSSLIGLQLTATLAKWADVVAQWVANGDGTNGEVSYRVNSGVAFLRIKLGTGLQFHFGRFRLPIFLYSSTEQVGYTYPWQYLPAEVYRLAVFNNMNGVSILYTKLLSMSGWNMTFDSFYGSNKSRYSIDPSTLAKFDEDDIIGSSVSMGNDKFTLRGAYAHVDLNNLDSTVASKNSALWSIGAKITTSPVFVIAEYARRKLNSQALLSMKGFYVTAGLRLGKLMPALTFASVKTTNTPTASTKESPERQTSYTLSCDYYINSNILAKLNTSLVRPQGSTSGFFTADPGKKSVYVIGAELDAIF